MIEAENSYLDITLKLMDEEIKVIDKAFEDKDMSKLNVSMSKFIFYATSFINCIKLTIVK